MAPKSIYRGPEAKHYTVVHRSQRDPLINDPEAGERVLREVQRQNEAKGRKKEVKSQTRHELESALGIGSSTLRPNVGEASMYNIYYDDSDYDYMQHLRPVGLTKEAVFVENPQKEKRKPQSDEPITFRQPDGQLESDSIQLPDSVQPTPADQTLSYKDHLEFALPSNSMMTDGLFPATEDPALQEILVALEDEAYIEEEADDGFFGTIVKDGERDASEEPEWMRDVEPPSEAQSHWESTVGQFKPPLADKRDLETASMSSLPSSDDDAVPELRNLSIRQAPQSRCSLRGSVAGSAFSMSSSAMFRNQGLTTLDDRFDKIEKEYEDSDPDDGQSDQSDMTATPGHIREDFDEIMDEFLDRYEVIGGKMKPVMAGKTPLEKLETMRTELLAPEDADDLERRLVKEKILMRLREDEKKMSSGGPKPRADTVEFEVDDQPHEKWDCQSILSTYSNVENHPRVIRIRDAIGANPKLTKAPASKIEIDRLTGFPMLNGQLVKGNLSNNNQTGQPSGSDSDSDLESAVSTRETIKRDRKEGKETKKARKAEVKAERATRRQEKKATKEVFMLERNKQQQVAGRHAARKAFDIAGMGGKGVINLL